MIRVDIESIVLAAAPVPSVIVLREREGAVDDDSPLRALSIQTGPYEAASIGQGIDDDRALPRPLAHDLLLDAVRKLGGKVERVEIRRWDAPVFYADVVIGRRGAANDEGEIRVDARPSDALAIAARANAPIYVEDDVMNRASSPLRGSGIDEEETRREFERFDAFVQTLTPDDF